MYEGPSFTSQQRKPFRQKVKLFASRVRWHSACNQKCKRKKRIRRLACELAVLLGVAAAALFLSDRLFLPKVWATPEKDIEELETIDFEDICGSPPEEESVPADDDGGDEQEPENAPPVVFIDAGHGGNDGGCFEGDIIEKNINLAIAKLVKDKLEASGFEVIMSRNNDTYVTKEDRVKKANSIHADIYVSIHQNSSDEPEVKGMEVWYDGTDTRRDSKRLALLVSHQTAKSAQALEREVRGDADFHVTGNTLMPACLIETGFITNKEERGLLATQEYQEQLASGIARGITYYFYPKTLYLTFDDGPSEENTLRVLDILKKRNIKATFFLVGENVERYPQIARRIAAEGHAIGIHCYSHSYKNLYKSVDSYVEDFERARQAVYQATGVDARIFRFPGGSINSYNKKVYADIIKEMTRKGYTYYDWNASLEDAAVQTEPAKLLNNGVQTTLGRSKVILLAHDVVQDTGTILDDLLDSLPEYEIKPLTEDVEPIHF